MSLEYYRLAMERACALHAFQNPILFKSQLILCKNSPILHEQAQTNLFHAQRFAIGSLGTVI